jgi:uncharacterized Rossmann fold enzyme
MDWNHWKYWYDKIISDFDYDSQKDAESAAILNTLLRDSEKIMYSDDLRKFLRGKIVFIYGCGPSLPKQVNILADGATSSLLELNITPNIIITDLDGRVSDQIEANRKGAVVIIHAHGDNIERINQYFYTFPGKLMGTTQNKPLSYVKNFGGFTDGDRCVFFAAEMEATTIFLFGFDFGNKIGRFSKPDLIQDEFASENKIKKLQWAERLISELSKETKSLIIQVNGTNVKSGNFKTCELRKVIKFLKNTN